MKKVDKKKYEETIEEPRTRSVTRKMNKPWCLEYFIEDESFMNTNSFYTNAKKVGEWTKDSWLDKLVSVDDALRQLNKIARGSQAFGKIQPIRFNWRFAGKKFRLVNKDTKEIVYLELTDREIILK